MKNDTDRPLFEDISVTGWVLIDKVKALIARGNVRRLIVRQPNGKVLIDVPLTAGVSVAAVLTLLMPMLTAIAAMGALFTQFRIEIERDPTLFDDDRSRDR
ncbi:DUF4342 domain-containing protein [Chromatium okenii]|jgi:hypothetical protein|uniref:DUF4342 domain-containing protein n=1 Tax=Chromatium okenii TaxID=61644 RepID=A0A2S7XN26_9GAMM|nr:DUF4342 domain-containing protein [Chromatium okenii]PQJ94838.1 hypothetical protein CXB77_18130 [Chromatium okenii]PQJ94894.1 hypothetical protein CXB77_17310 [Chromatium okenii]